MSPQRSSEFRHERQVMACLYAVFDGQQLCIDNRIAKVSSICALLYIFCNPDDLFEVMKALDKLNDRSMSMNITVFAVASAKPDQPFIANTLHNLVVEPMLEESDVVIQEEQVEE